MDISNTKKGEMNTGNMIIGKREFDTKSKCYIMGIINVTPDSFSDGGRWLNPEAALRHAEEMIEHGADILDVGGESTRPGYIEISESEEIDRVIPVIEALFNRFDIPISIDTYKSKVAAAAVASGAALVNDIWGLKHDDDMAEIIAKTGAACCLMHNREQIDYNDFLTDMLCDLSESADIARRAGIADNKIILDPGVGFAKTYEMNLEAINKIDEIRKLGYPVLLGVSRKSVVGITLDLPVTERLEGSLAAGIVGVIRGCSFLRVHDVKETRRAVTMIEAIISKHNDK